MAGLNVAFSTPAVSLTSGTARTALQVLAPTNQRLMLRSLAVSFSGGASSDPQVQIRLLKQTTAGTMTTGTIVKTNGGSETVQSTARHSATSTEPTAGDVLAVYTCHPQSNIGRSFAYGQIPVFGGERIAIELLASSSGLSGYVTLEWDE